MTDTVVADLTSGTINGSGIFDTLMKAIDVRLQAQYNLGNITGTDYSTVYLGAMQTAMQQSVAVLLGLETMNKNIELVDAQITKTQAEELLTEQRLITETANTSDTLEGGGTIDGLVGLQKDLLIKQSLQTVSSTNLVDQQILSEEAKILDTVNSLAVAGSIGSTKAVNAAQIDKIVTEEALTQQKVYTEEAQILDIVNATTVAGVLSKQKDLIGAQAFKVTTESGLVTQKILTEEAQTLDNVGGSPNVVTGTIGAQNKVLAAQTKGYALNAEHKVFSTLVQAYNVRFSTDKGVGTPVRLENPEISDLIEQVRSNVEIPSTLP